MRLRASELLEIFEKQPEDILSVSAQYDYENRKLVSVSATLIWGSLTFANVEVEFPTTKADLNKLRERFYRNCSLEQSPSDGALKLLNFDIWINP